jgi:hypothetical protein
VNLKQVKTNHSCFWRIAGRRSPLAPPHPAVLQRGHSKQGKEKA